MSGLIWNDIEFDHIAANEAIRSLERAAAQLDQVSTDRAGHATRARQDWSGPTRVEFDHTFDPALRQAGDLAAALRRAAGTIQQAMTDATAEQQRRLKARADHLASAVFSVIGCPTPENGNGMTPWRKAGHYGLRTGEPKGTL